jgi:NADPH:quinone reductase-like Zn-dependent oxidoreductase
VICDVLGKALPRQPARAQTRRPLPAGRLSGGVSSILATLVRGLWARMRGRAVFITGAAAPVQADLEFLKTLVEAGRLRIVVGRRFALSEIVEAHRHADAGHKVGNLVVVVGGAIQ